MIGDRSKLGPETIPGETKWSRTLKVTGLVWIVLGALAAILWLFQYRQKHLPGMWGWVLGVGGLALTVTFGVLLNLIAQLSDHMRASRPEQDSARS